MSRRDVHRCALITSLACSALALFVVFANILAGIGPKADETTSAHLWQLLMAAQVPLVAVSIGTGDLRRRLTIPMMALQLALIAGACVPVWLAHY